MTCRLSGQVRNACPFMVPVPKPPDSERGAGTRGLRPSFVSLLVDDSMSIEHIAHLVGRISTVVAGTVHR